MGLTSLLIPTIQHYNQQQRPTTILSLHEKDKIVNSNCFLVMVGFLWQYVQASGTAVTRNVIVPRSTIIAGPTGFIFKY